MLFFIGFSNNIALFFSLDEKPAVPVDSMMKKPKRIIYSVVT